MAGNCYAGAVFPCRRRLAVIECEGVLVPDISRPLILGCLNEMGIPRPPSYAVKKSPSSHRHFYLVSFLFPLSFFLVLLVTPIYVWSATYYVDATGGRDTNSALSQAAAWKTIAKVNASRFNPGDQILLRRGGIWMQTLVVPSSGSPSKPIVFGAYGVGTNPVLTGSSSEICACMLRGKTNYHTRYYL